MPREHDWFADCGAEIERAWSAAGRDEEAFPEIADAVLARRPPGDSVDLDAFVAHALDPARALPRQFARPGVFGQPGITAFSGRDFVIEVYFWSSSSSAIHNHPFCGVFTLLRGFSVHARYHFELEREVGPNVRIGRVALASLDAFAPGPRVLFSLREHPLVHSLVHVPNPSVSLVVRTTRTDDYWRYLPPTLAVRIGAEPPDQERRLLLLDFLRRSGDPRWDRHVAAVITSHGLDVAIALLSRIHADGDADRFARCLALVRGYHGDAALAIEPALVRGRRRALEGTLRDRLGDPEHRFIATVLAHAVERPQVLRLLAGRYGEAAGARFDAFLQHAVFPPDHPGLEVARMLVEDAPADLDIAAARASVDRYFRGSLLDAMLPWP